MEMTLYVIIGVLLVIVFILAIAVAKKGKKTDIEEIRKELAFQLKNNREEITNNIGSKIVDNTTIQQNSIASLTNLNETKLENIRKSVEEKLLAIQKIMVKS